MQPVGDFYGKLSLWSKRWPDASIFLKRCIFSPIHLMLHGVSSGVMGHVAITVKSPLQPHLIGHKVTVCLLCWWAYYKLLKSEHLHYHMPLISPVESSWFHAVTGAKVSHQMIIQTNSKHDKGTSVSISVDCNIGQYTGSAMMHSLKTNYITFILLFI